MDSASTSAKRSKRFIWDAAAEAHLIRAMEGLMPVGINKHFHMAGIVERLSESLKKEISSKDVWNRLHSKGALKNETEKPPALPEREFSLSTSEFGALLSKLEGKSSEPAIQEEAASTEKTSHMLKATCWKCGTVILLRKGWVVVGPPVSGGSTASSKDFPNTASTEKFATSKVTLVLQAAVGGSAESGPSEASQQAHGGARPKTRQFFRLTTQFPECSAANDGGDPGAQGTGHGLASGQLKEGVALGHSCAPDCAQLRKPGSDTSSAKEPIKQAKKKREAPKRKSTTLHGAPKTKH